MSHSSRYTMSGVYLFASCRSTDPAGALFQLTQQPQGVESVFAAKLLSCLIGNADIGTFRHSVNLTDIVCSKLYAANPCLLPLRHARDRRRERGCDTTCPTPDTTLHPLPCLLFFSMAVNNIRSLQTSYFARHSHRSSDINFSFSFSPFMS